jgi:hypothetical protein
MLNKNSLKVVLVHVLQCWYKKIKNNNILEYTAGKKKKRFIITSNHIFLKQIKEISHKKKKTQKRFCRNVSSNLYICPIMHNR